MVEIAGRTLRVGPAVLGSLAGTVLFGIVMTMMGMMPMVAALVGSDWVAVGWGVHIAIGALFGVGFAGWLAFVRMPTWISGIAYGVVVWVFGPLVVMPLWLGMPQMVMNLAVPTPWLSLVGHVMYGLVAGLVFAWLTRTPVGLTPPRRPAGA